MHNLNGNTLNFFWQECFPLRIFMVKMDRDNESAAFPFRNAYA